MFFCFLFFGTRSHEVQASFDFAMYPLLTLSQLFLLPPFKSCDYQPTLSSFFSVSLSLYFCLCLHVCVYVCICLSAFLAFLSRISRYSWGGCLGLTMEPRLDLNVQWPFYLSLLSAVIIAKSFYLALNWWFLNVLIWVYVGIRWYADLIS